MKNFTFKIYLDTIYSHSLTFAILFRAFTNCEEKPHYNLQLPLNLIVIGNQSTRLLTLTQSNFYLKRDKNLNIIS
jgi:hypothetical protein